MDCRFNSISPLPPPSLLPSSTAVVKSTSTVPCYHMLPSFIRDILGINPLCQVNDLCLLLCKFRGLTIKLYHFQPATFCHDCTSIHNYPLHNNLTWPHLMLQTSLLCRGGWTHIKCKHVTGHATKFFNGEMYREPSFLPCPSAIPKVSMPLESPLGIDSEYVFYLTQPLGARGTRGI